ncbi:MAG TPA: 6-carboxytetrahydropterin synthase [Longimicrobiales bacterium]|jgi:6-pyruvoyltetrahydropterin/6-carboxytetrahydropterin synthase
MSSASLVRTVHFSAGHHYWRSEWSEEDNRRSFGASANPHGHNYTLEVTVRGRVDPATGFVVDLGALDAVLADVVNPLDQNDLNEVIPEVREGGMVPTTENLARWFMDRLRDRIPGQATLARVRVAESGELAAEVTAEEP